MPLLIVEDNEALSENLSELFTAEGFEVLCAKNGHEALQKAALGFKIAILDLRLPDTTGTALLQKLKEFAPDAEALLLTGDADVNSAIEAVRAGAFAYLIKPVDFSSNSQEATYYACRLAKQNEASVTLLHVYEFTPYLAPTDFAVLDDKLLEIVKIAAEESILKAKEEAQRKIKEEAQKLEPPHVESLLVVGIPFMVITQTAKEGGYDLIVLGTHGRTGLKHVLIGSVAERVVQHASCPVLVVPPCLGFSLYL
jgi:nucleotide-binding universal stress UspA family protein